VRCYGILLAAAAGLWPNHDLIMNTNSNSQDKLLVFRVAGDLVSTTAGALRGEISASLEAAGSAPTGWNLLRLDLSAAKMIDSVGLNLVVTLLKQVQEHGARMQVIYSSPNVLRTFAFTRLDKHVEIIKA